MYGVERTRMTTDNRPEWLLATTNVAKQHELGALLADLPVRWRSLRDYANRPEVEESGVTFQENALLKARAYSGWSGLPALADDGGLEIDALGGQPGVHSRRWPTGVEADDETLIAYTMARMRGVPLEERGAQLRVVLCLAFPDGSVVYGGGVIRGIITPEPSPKREVAFPYRSVFFLPQFAKYYLELSEEEHELVNHRRTAVQELRRALQRK